MPNMKGYDGQNARGRKKAAKIGGRSATSEKESPAKVSSAAVTGKNISVTSSLSVPSDSSGKAPTTNGRVGKKSDSGTATRPKSRSDGDRGSQLAGRLAAIASSVKPGRGKISQIVSGGLSGAAVGAAFDEERASAKRRKAKAKKDAESQG